MKNLDLEKKRRKIRRVTIDLSSEDFQSLEELKDTTGRTSASIVRSALNLYSLLHSRYVDGHRFFFKKGENSTEIIIQL